MARVLLFCVLLVAGASLPAQRIYLPVKVKHKWTFVAYLDTAIIDLSRQFDYISDINLPWFGQPGTSSGYYHIENNGKLGLANANFEIALEPAWQEIHPISHQFFLVSDGYYTVIDSSNTDLFNGNRFEAVQLAEQGGHEFFLVKEKGKWGACRAGENRLALPPAYHEIGYLKAGKGLFKVKYDHLDTLGWYVVDWEGEKLPNLKRPQELTMAAGPKYILTQQKASYTNWSIRDLTGKEVMILDPWAEVLPLNSYLLGYKQKPGALLKVLVLEDEIRTVPEEFNYLEAVNDDLAFFKTQTQSGFILPNGDLLILGGPEISAAEPGKGDLYRIKCTSAEGKGASKWGLYSLEKKEVLLPCQYDSIGLFYGNLAHCTLNGKVGLLNSAPREIIPPLYEAIPDIAEDIRKVQCYWKDSTMVYYISPDGEPDGPPYAERYIPIVGKGIFYGLNFDYENDSGAPRRLRAPEEPVSNSGLLVDLVPEDRKDTLWIDEKRFWGYSQSRYQMVKLVKRRTPSQKGKKSKKKKKGPNTADVAEMRWRESGPVYRHLRYCKEVNWTLAYLDRSAENSAGSLEIHIFLDDTRAFIPDFAVAGIRLSDFKRGLPYAAFIDLNGKMGLIGRSGQQVTGPTGIPLRFSSIGISSEGKIPVCHEDYPIASAFGTPGFPGSSPVTKSFFQETADRVNQPRDRRPTQKPRWGYIDIKGNLAIPFQFEEAGGFLDSFALCRSNGKLGVINHANEPVVPFDFDDIKEEKGRWRVFIDLKNQEPLYFDIKGRLFPNPNDAGLAGKGQVFFPKKNDSQPPKFGFVDLYGQQAIPPQYDEVNNFSEGLAAVRMGKQWQFIDRHGNFAFAIDSTIQDILEVGQFQEGLCLVRKQRLIDGKSRRKFGYIDTSGRWAITPVFDKAQPFEGGFALVDSLYLAYTQIDNKPKLRSKKGLIDREGNLVVGYQYERIFPFNEAGYAEAADSNWNKRGIIDRTGKLFNGRFYRRVVPLEDGVATFDGFDWKVYDYKGREIAFPIPGIKNVRYFSDGHLIVQDTFFAWNHFVLSNGKALRKQGDLSEFQPFQFGYSLVKFIDQELLYNKHLNWVEPDKGQKFKFWSNKLIGVEEGGQSYYLNIDKQNVYYRRFDEVAEFKGSVAAVTYRGRAAFINRNGMFLIPPKYPSATYRNGVLEVQPLPHLIGLIAKDGKVIIPPRYDVVTDLDANVIRVEKDDRIGYYRTDGQLIWDAR